MENLNRKDVVDLIKKYRATTVDSGTPVLMLKVPRKATFPPAIANYGQLFEASGGRLMYRASTNESGFVVQVVCSDPVPEE